MLFKILIVSVIFVNLSESNERSTRALTFPRGTTNGYVVAAAFPLDLPENNVYVSYNFEANYVLPSESTQFTQELYDKIVFITGVKDSIVDQEVIAAEAARRQLNPGLFTRNFVYRMIEQKMEAHGLKNGHDCLLRIICEVAKSDLIQKNGIIGNIFHLLFTPSSSIVESNMNQSYYKSETSTDCSDYSSKCDTRCFGVVNSSESIVNVQKRATPFVPVLYPVNAATGILVAIAIPLSLPNRNVFVSYNFEANYNMPNIPSDSFPGPIKRLPGLVVNNNLDYMLLSRKSTYRVLENRMDANGLNGKKCLLLAICESAQIPLLEHNGILGHILHIILTPSSSMNESLPLEYNKAEDLGTQHKCRKYEKHCAYSMLKLITTLI
ncbi:unnamed protein product [Diamesa serratosioi]